MIPILFLKAETAFTGNGLGRLTDAIKCEVTEERNGVYECELKYPVTGALFPQMAEGCYIYTTHDESGSPQPFEIYFRSAPLNGVVTFRAWHISYMLNNIIVRPFTAGSASAAIAQLSPQSINANPFTFWTDKEVTADYSLDTPRAIRAVLGGQAGSLLDTYGKGDYEFDMYTVRLWLNRGTNRGVSIRYGKNLTSLEQQRDASGMFVGVVPYWTDTEGNSVSLDYVVYRTGETSGPVIAYDMSDRFSEAPTTAQLEAAAQSYVNNSEAYEIKENITIDFVALWQTEEYKDVANLQRIYLCDTVNIFYEKLGINATAKCIKVVYDSLLERYTSMELGTPRTTLAQQILETTSSTLLQDVPSKSAMQSAIDKATEMIAGGFGGYIKFNYLSDGTPSEMLIMNTASESTATNIIRLNQNGIGFSTDGGTTYTNAWTIDGNLNADFINAGTLSGVRVEATSGNIGRWEINTSALYKDVQGTDGYVYRVYFQPPLADGSRTWVLSCQKSQTQGSVGDNLAFDGVFILYSDGSAKFGDTTISQYGRITMLSDETQPTSGTLTIQGIDGARYYLNQEGLYARNANNEALFTLLTTTGRSSGSLSVYGADRGYTYVHGGGLAKYDDAPVGSVNTPRLNLGSTELAFRDSDGNYTTRYPAAVSELTKFRYNLPSGLSDWSSIKKLGNLVIVNFNGAITGGLADRSTILQALPAADGEYYGVIRHATTGAAYAIGIANDGTNVLTYSALPSANAYYIGQLVYLTSSP